MQHKSTCFIHQVENDLKVVENKCKVFVLIQSLEECHKHTLYCAILMSLVGVFDP